MSRFQPGLTFQNHPKYENQSIMLKSYKVFFCLQRNLSSMRSRSVQEDTKARIFLLVDLQTLPLSICFIEKKGYIFEVLSAHF